MTVSITQSLHRALQQNPQRIATVACGRRQTYAEFVGRIQRLAGGLRGLGVKNPAIASCAVIGIPSEKWGESVHAVVVLKQDQSVSQAELIAHCKTLIAGYKCPRSVEVSAELPLSGAGKIQKNKLREPHWADRGRQVA